MASTKGLSGLSRLPKPSHLKTPVHGMKRRSSIDRETISPEKRQRLSDGSSTASSDESLDKKKMPCPLKRAPTTRSTKLAPGKLRRSVSMASIPVPARGIPPRTGVRAGITPLSRSKTGNSSSNLLGRASSVTASFIQRNKPKTPALNNNARHPGANITNRVNNKPTQPKKESGIDAPSIGKGKRPAWDLKGRLMDMESILKENCAKMSQYDSRIASMETENSSLTQNLHETKSYSKEAESELSGLREDLRKCKETFSEERRNLEEKVRDYEFKISSQERRLASLESELQAKMEEVSGLRTSVAQMTSSREGLEAELQCKRDLLEDSTKKINNLESVNEQQKKSIEEMTRKIMEGETIRRKLHNSVLELKGNIRVFCRVRPLLGEELSKNGSDHIHHMNFLDEKSLELIKSGNLDGSSMSGLKSRSSNYDFSFDHVFAPCDSQEQVFDEISQLSQSALDGYNVCVFAYGQTGSGKTFTMEGVYGDDAKEGMIPRTVKHIFSSINELEDKGWEYTVEVSILEIYNENIRDLLVNPKEAKNLSYDIKLVDNKKSDIFVTNLKVVTVTNAEEVHQLLTTAQQHRAVAATNMNNRSSRSHSVFQLKIKGKNLESESFCEGTLNLVDLAGSERLKDSGSEGARLTETQNINKSLANLGNVIMALAQKQTHIPYRNSKLTQLLQNSLGGNSKTLMFVNLSPSDSCFNESLNSLRFATKVNQCHIGTAVKQIKK